MNQSLTSHVIVGRVATLLLCLEKEEMEGRKHIGRRQRIGTGGGAPGVCLEVCQVEYLLWCGCRGERGGKVGEYLLGVCGCVGGGGGRRLVCVCGR